MREPDTHTYEAAIAAGYFGRHSNVDHSDFTLGPGVPAIPAPDADFVIIPPGPSTDQEITLNGAPSTPLEHLVEWSWRQVSPSGPTIQTETPVHVVAPQPAGPYVVGLRVRTSDGQVSAERQRGVSVTEAR